MTIARAFTLGAAAATGAIAASTAAVVGLVLLVDAFARARGRRTLGATAAVASGRMPDVRDRWGAH